MRKSLAERDLLFVFFIVLFAAAAAAVWMSYSTDEPASGGRGAAILLDRQHSRYSVNEGIQALADESGKLTFEQARSLGADGRFVSVFGTSSFGYTAKTFWIRTNVVNESDTDRWTLRLSNAALNEVDAYANGQKLERIGDSAIGYRLNDPYYAYEIRVPRGQSAVVYVRAVAEGAMILPLELMDGDAYRSKLRTEYVLFGLYFGCALLMAAYSLIRCVSLRSGPYGFFALCLLFFSLSQAIRGGFLQALLGGERNGFLRMLLRVFGSYEGMILVCSLLCLSFALFFLAGLLEWNKRYPWTNRAATVLSGASVVVALAVLVRGSDPFAIAVRYQAVAVVFLVAAVARCAFKGSRPARYVLLGMIGFLGCALPAVLYDLGFREYGALHRYGFQFGSVAGFLLSAVALSPWAGRRIEDGAWPAED